MLIARIRLGVECSRQGRFQTWGQRDQPQAALAEHRVALVWPPKAPSELLARNLFALCASLRHPYRHRLLFAFVGLAALAALERPSLTALHGALHITGCGLGVSSYLFTPSFESAKTRTS
jgi:hypothetical protein